MVFPLNICVNIKSGDIEPLMEPYTTSMCFTYTKSRIIPNTHGDPTALTALANIMREENRKKRTAERQDFGMKEALVILWSSKEEAEKCLITECDVQGVGRLSITMTGI